MTDERDRSEGADADAAGAPETSAVAPVAGRGVVYLLPTAAGRSDDDPDGGLDQRTEQPPWAEQILAASVDGDPEPEESRDTGDWAWVEEWRAGQEPTPWATGLPLTAFAALVVAVAIWVLSAGLSDRPLVAVLVNVLVAAGLAPAVWLSRGLPVLRWIAAGCAAGVLIGWISAILMLSLPVT
jgi:hypothetical protein